MPQKIVPFLWFNGQAEEAVALVDDARDADVAVVNTCGFVEQA